ncbi:hypothetical protein FKZ61_010855 [Litorilinea aerophila]|uniref:General stress protein 17M-like domain-containing protein n=1 Tax=Litorilinea aerophila TaxID=1204385 RepID=A0A540VFR0_9CHLR|nr:hypothetical protein [Litorilinea aerophila]MCC9076608.1 hypothetical protein [Litorilinea aerophila]OUC09159.1 hypothetical protein RY27_04545 [Litorilinea aerophila]GIV77644.1 MAG: hypothetical protein KatS3mg050_2038 [Litorilinea sp.]
MSYVIGLFDDEHLTELVDQLKDHGMEDHYRVIDRGVLGTKSVVAVPGTDDGGTAGVAPAGVIHVGTTGFDAEDLNIDDVLDEYGFEDEEKAFFVRSIQDGASMVVVEVPSDQADAISQMMEEAQAQHVYISV